MGTASASSTFGAAAPVTAVRLEPVAWSWNPLVWLALAIYRTLGVTSPIRVIFARAPRLIVAHLVLVITAEYGVSLDRRLRALARVFGSRTNGCLFCDDLETRLAIEHGTISREDAEELADYAASERFSPRERATLHYVEELNTTRRVSDETFHELRRHLSEREVVELTWINAVGNYLNLQAKPLGLVPETCELPDRRSAAEGT